MARAVGPFPSAVLVLAAGAVASSGCASTSADWRERYLEKEKDATDLGAQLSEERNAHAAAVAQLEEARARMKALEQENEAMRSRPAEAAAVAAPPAIVDDPANDAVERLKKEGMDAHVTADGNIAIVLPADINFGSGSKDLSPAGRKTVDQIARELEGQFAGATIRIEGHTDADPIRKSKFKDNWELGAERALTVLRYLVEEKKVAPERLVAASRGDTVPVADNKSDKGKEKNRRVEVVVLVPRDAALAK